MNERTQESKLSDIQARQELLDQFARQPDDSGLWQTAYGWAIAEDTAPAEGGIAHDIPGDEIIAFANHVRACPASGRYDLTAGFASNGQRWFDALELFSSPQIDEAIAATLGGWTTEGRFQEALDIGTGTGRMLPILGRVAEHVTGLDRNAVLLDMAAKQNSGGATLIQGEIAQLPFVDQAFDLATSGGVSGSLDATTKTAFYRELNRILRPGGVYIEGSYYEDDQGSAGPELGKSTQTAKGMLADMIVDTVSGKHALSGTLSFEKERELLAELGLERNYYLYTNEITAAETLLSVIRK